MLSEIRLALNMEIFLVRKKSSIPRIFILGEFKKLSIAKFPNSE